MSRSAATRELVLTTALRSFRERGYEKTTMRLVASEAGVSLGNAYYYFPSKAHLVREMYGAVVGEQAARARVALAGRRGLGLRLAAVWHAAIDASEPYHELGGELVGEAIRPGSPVSPFAPESADTRAASVAVFDEVLAGSHPAVPARLRAELPYLLWLAQLGIEVFWVHDDSPGRARTRALVDGAAPLVAGLVNLARLPVANAVVGEALALVRRVRT